MGGGLHGRCTPGPAGVQLLMHLLCKYLIVHPIIFLFAVYVTILHAAKGACASRGLGHTVHAAGGAMQHPCGMVGLVPVCLLLSLCECLSRTTLVNHCFQSRIRVLEDEGRHMLWHTVCCAGGCIAMQERVYHPQHHSFVYRSLLITAGCVTCPAVAEKVAM